MSKQQGNPAPAGGIAGWPGEKGHGPAGGTGLPVFFPLRAAVARYKALRQQWQRAVAGRGKAVSVDELTRHGAGTPLFNFTGSPGALQWWPNDHRPS